MSLDLSGYVLKRRVLAQRLLGPDQLRGRAIPTSTTMTVFDKQTIFKPPESLIGCSNPILCKLKS